MEAALEHFWDEVALWSPRIGAAVLIVVAAWILAHVTDRAISRLAARTGLNLLIVPLLSRASRIALVLFGVVTALGTLGININAIVAGLGLTGFALGFALRDTISNLLAGVLLLIYRPFDIRHHIKVAAHEGVVVAIDLRYTTLENDNARILIPNSVLFTDPITIIKNAPTQVQQR